MKKCTMLAFVVSLAALLASCGSSGNSSDLLTISVTPNNMSINRGATIQYTATGKYSDDSTGDLTSSVTWSSSNTVVSIISNTSGSQGMATGLASGTTTIIATDPTTSRSGFTTLNVI